MLSWFERGVDPYPAELRERLPNRLLPFLWACSRGARPFLLALTLLTALTGAFEALLFSMLGSIVDWLAETPPTQFWASRRGELMLLAGVVLASPLLVALQTIVKHQALAGNFAMLLRWNFHRLLLGQSIGFFQDEFAGRIATKVMQTALAVRDTWLIGAEILVFMAVHLITLTAIAASFHRWLLLPFVGWMLLYAAAVRYFVPRLGRVAAKQADARSLMAGRITDAYTHIATVKLFSHTHGEARHARRAMQEFMRSVQRQMRLVSGFDVVNHALSMLLAASTAGISLWLWSRGEVGVGAVAAATAMALRLSGIAHWVMWEVASLFEHLGTVHDGMRLLSRQRLVLDAPGAQPLVVRRGEVRLDQVAFGYPGGEAVIRGVSLLIRPGEKIGLVGRSGAGKSTLVNLLLRLNDLDGGRILIDGQDVAQVLQESLRAQIGVVTQDTSLLHRTVRENIAYGRQDATDDEVRRAAERAEAHAFITDLVDPAGCRGYDAQVGERGVRLSGGQRQRIAIARVMLKNAPILLLDEATSALDSEVEAAIQASLYRLMEGKTVIAIAHRLSTIAAMDRLVVLDGGRIVESGDHRSLVDAGGLYARLWARQSGGFIGEDTGEESAGVAEPGSPPV